MKTFNRREWLNPETISSTGSAVAYHGPAHWAKDDQEIIDTFFEVGDCQAKVRLHRCSKDSMEDYISKVEKLAHMAIEFAEFLKRNEKDQSE